MDIDFIDDHALFDRSLPNEKIILTKHLFLPSGNFMWEIQSKKNNSSYYIDHSLTSCSCKGFYYNYSRKKCYHLSDASSCVENSNYTISVNEDKYYHQIVKRIILHTISDS